MERNHRFIRRTSNTFASSGVRAVLALAAIAAGFADGNSIDWDVDEVHVDFYRLMAKGGTFIFLHRREASRLNAIIDFILID